MGSSKIEWTDYTWNPIKARRKDTGKVGWHCEKCSPACQHCYACVFNLRNLPNGGTGLDYTVLSREKVEIFLDLDVLRQPFHWKKPRRVFVCSMTDLFGEFVPDEMIAHVWKLMERTPQHTYQVLTKRAERMRAIMPALVNTFGVLQNVQVGVTVENQEYADLRIPHLLSAQLATRFISYEPALGAIRMRRLDLGICKTKGYGDRRIIVDALDGSERQYLPKDVKLENAKCISVGTSRPRLAWVIAGGESGSSARPSHPDWFRSVRDDCAAAGVPFFFKQWGSWKPISEMPESEHSTYYRSVKKARAGEEWRQPDIDDVYGRVPTVPNAGIRFDGTHGPRVMYEVLDGHPTYATFFLGKKKAGRQLDGRTWDEFPGGLS